MEAKLAKRRAVGKYKYKFNKTKMKIVFTSVVAGRRTSLPGGAIKYKYNINQIKIVFATLIL